jgi:hypothetical protein
MGCSKSGPTPIVNNRTWIEDINFIKQELPARHVNLFTNMSQQEFDIEIESLIEKTPQLDENEIICELMKIFSKIGDSHTGIHNGMNMSKFNIAPIKYEVYDDGIYIVEIIESGRDYLKQKVAAIDNVPINKVYEKISTVLPHENDYFLKSAIPDFLRLYEILDALEITSSKNSYQLTLGNGETFQVRGNAYGHTNFISCYSTENTPFYLQNNEDNYWYRIIDGNIVYLQYNQCVEMGEISFKEFSQQMFAELNSKQIDKFIIDIRLNSGGSSLIIAPLIEELQKHNELQDKIYCCIGDKTASSGLINAFQLQNDLGAILIGEPTGGKPNHFGEVREFSLPNTKLIVRYSTKYFELQSGNDNESLEPDYYVENNSYDSFNGIDPCVEFVRTNN